jgi:hypothetical protein
MNDKIWEFTCPWDKDQLLNEFDVSTTKKFSERSRNWKRTWDLGDYGMGIKNNFKPRHWDNPRAYVGYYLQQAGTEIRPHTDGECFCRVNVLLSGGPEPLIIGGESVQYECALINVSEYEHYVETVAQDRLLFSVCFVDMFFEDAKNFLQTYSYP